MEFYKTHPDKAFYILKYIFLMNASNLMLRAIENKTNSQLSFLYENYKYRFFVD